MKSINAFFLPESSSNMATCLINAYQSNSERYKSDILLPKKCALHLTLYACQMFQIQDSLVEPGLCLNKNREQIPTNTCADTQCMHTYSHRRFSASFFGSNTLKGVWLTHLHVSKIYTFSLTPGEGVLCFNLFGPHLRRQTYTHAFVSLISMTRAFWSLTLNLQCPWADVRIKADGWR